MPTPNRSGSGTSSPRNSFSASTWIAIRDAASIACRAGRLRIGGEAEQGQLSVADELVWLSAAFDHGLRDSRQEAVDDENGIERQKLLGELGRSAHVHEHADDVTLPAGKRRLDGCRRRGSRMRGKDLEERDIGPGA